MIWMANLTLTINTIKLYFSDQVNVGSSFPTTTEYPCILPSQIGDGHSEDCLSSLVLSDTKKWTLFIRFFSRL